MVFLVFKLYIEVDIKLKLKNNVFWIKYVVDGVIKDKVIFIMFIVWGVCEIKIVWRCLWGNWRVFFCYRMIFLLEYMGDIWEEG